MLLPAELVAVVAGILVALVTSIVLFGHRFADKCSKLDEKSCTDELNEIRFSIRANSTASVLYKVWNFLSDLEHKLTQKELMDASYVTSLLFNIEHREKFNKLISEVEDTFKESKKVKDAYDTLKLSYTKLSRTLYIFALIIGLTGFPIVCLSAPSVTIIPPDQVTILWIAVIGIGIFSKGDKYR